MENSRLPTCFLEQLIDEYGPENVMLLAQSCNSESCPIRTHVNALVKKTDGSGSRKYHFDVKFKDCESAKRADLENKVRVWTFCGAKGCEADVVVVFGFDSYNLDRITPVNQVCCLELSENH